MQLTSLSLNVETATAQLMHHIVEFRNLQSVSIAFEDVSLRVLEPLSALKELTSLELERRSEVPLKTRHGPAASSIHEQTTRLEAAILESARRVGALATVKLEGLQNV